jgi:hypothetical protein
MSNKSEKLLCAVCGSENVTITEHAETHDIPYGEPVVIKTVIHVCKDCGAEIDATQDTARLTALVEAQKTAIDRMLGFLSESGYTLSNIERALGLPQRTLSRWKGGQDPSAAGLALLRIIRTYPWVIKVADEKFNSSIASAVLAQQAVDAISDIMRQKFSFELQQIGAVQTTGFEEKPNAAVTFFATYMGNKAVIQDEIAIGEKEPYQITYEVK